MQASPLSPAEPMLANAPSPAEEGAAQRAAEQSQLLLSVKQELAQHFHYPLQAIRRGWQGTVQLAFMVDETGAIHDIQVAQSSGHALLDRAAIQALSRVGPLVQGPRQSHSLQLPVSYRLVEG